MPTSHQTNFLSCNQIASLVLASGVLALAVNQAVEMWPRPRVLTAESHLPNAALTPIAVPHYAENLVTYPIRGATFSELDDEISNYGPRDDVGKGWDAWTAWNVTWNYKFLQTPEGCTATQIRINTTAEILMPDWVDNHLASAEMQKAWRDYYDHLLAHERGHARIGQETAGLVHEAIASAHPAATCSEFRDRVDTEAQHIVGDGADKDRAYDVKTRHGVTQGVARPVDRPN